MAALFGCTYSYSPPGTTSWTTSPNQSGLDLGMLSSIYLATRGISHDGNYPKQDRRRRSRTEFRCRDDVGEKLKTFGLGAGGGGRCQGIPEEGDPLRRTYSFVSATCFPCPRRHSREKVIRHGVRTLLCRLLVFPDRKVQVVSGSAKEQSRHPTKAWVRCRVWA